MRAVVRTASSIDPFGIGEIGTDEVPMSLAPPPVPGHSIPAEFNQAGDLAMLEAPDSQSLGTGTEPWPIKGYFPHSYAMAL